MQQKFTKSYTPASIKLFILTKDFSDFSESSRVFFYKTQSISCVFSLIPVFSLSKQVVLPDKKSCILTFKCVFSSFKC